jgi:hypothetical protein
MPEEPEDLGEALESLTAEEAARLPLWVAGVVKEVIDQLRGIRRPTPEQLVIQEAVRGIGEQLRANIEAGPIVRDYLLRTGWFLTGSFPSMNISDLGRMVEADDLAGAEALMVEYARAHVDRIEEALAEGFPHRCLIIGEAFRAHREARYALSVPTLLAQADGLAEEILQTDLYRKANQKKGEADVPRTRKAYRGRLADDSKADRYPWRLLFAHLDVLTSLTQPLDEWRSARAVDAHYGPVNRHGVLHGSDFDYAREEISLRCILLLGYLEFVGDWLMHEGKRGREGK